MRNWERVRMGQPVSTTRHWSRPISALERLIMKRNAETGAREACRSLRGQVDTLEQAADRLDRLIAEHVTEPDTQP